MSSECPRYKRNFGRFLEAKMPKKHPLLEGPEFSEGKGQRFEILSGAPSIAESSVIPE